MWRFLRCSSSRTHFRKEKGVTLTLSEGHDVPHLSVLAQQNGQLLYTSILFSARHKHSNQGKRWDHLFFIKTEWPLGKTFITAVVFHLPSPHLKLTMTPSPPSTSGIPGLTKKKPGIKMLFWTHSYVMSCEFKA